MRKLRSRGSLRFRGLYREALSSIGEDATIKPHRRVLRALAYGGVPSFGPTLPPSNQGMQARATREIKASFISWLLLNPNARTYFHDRCVKIRGAEIVGAINLRSSSSDVSLTLEQCRLSGVWAQNSTLNAISLLGCELWGFRAEKSNFNALALSEGSVCHGEVCLLGARIATFLNLSSATFEGDPTNFGKAISADSVRVGGEVFIRNSRVERGEVRFIGARIEGDAYFNETVIRHPGHIALCLDRAQVAGSLHLSDQFIVQGITGINGCVIGGDLRLIDACFDNAQETHFFPADKPYCVMAQLTTVHGALTIQGVIFLGPVDLSSISVGILHDEESSWPTEIEFGNFRLEHISFRSPCDAASRLELLSRLPLENSFDQHPYVEFAQTLAKQGAQADAHKIMEAYWWRRLRTDAECLQLSLENRVRTIRKHDPVAKPFPYRDGVLFMIGAFINGAVTGFGYARWRSLAWLVLLIILSSITFTFNSDDMDQRMTSDATNQVPCSIAGTLLFCGDASSYVKDFSPVMYSIDAVIPLIDLHYASNWAPVNWWLSTVFLPLYIGLGWLLLSLFVASFAQVIRRI